MQERACYVMQSVHIAEPVTLNFSGNFGQLINRMERLYRLFMDDKMRYYGINGRMSIYVLYLDKFPGASQDALAAHCVLDKCTIARGAKRLESLGYITRQVNCMDRRQYHLRLTPKGAELLDAIRSCQQAWANLYADVLTEQEQQTVITLLQRGMEHNLSLQK